MTNAIRFTVPGDPVAKGRARSKMIDGRMTHYTPQKTAAYEAQVAWYARQAMGSAGPLAGAVSVCITAIFGIPASWSKKRQEAALGRDKISRPDLDNVVKSIGDSCNGIVWNDDSQITYLSCAKMYGENARVIVEVTG